MMMVVMVAVPIMDAAGYPNGKEKKNTDPHQRRHRQHYYHYS
jgi:hypothetical protein